MRKRNIQTPCHNILTFANMKSKPNVTYGMHIFQRNIGGRYWQNKRLHTLHYSPVIVRSKYIEKIPGELTRAYTLLQYLKRSNDLYHLREVNAKMNTGERWCESLCTEINSLKMGSRGGLTRTVFTDVSESTLPQPVIDIYADDGSSKFLWQGGTHLLQDYTVSRLWIQ